MCNQFREFSSSKLNLEKSEACWIGRAKPIDCNWINLCNDKIRTLGVYNSYDTDLKYVSKIYELNFEMFAVTRSCIRLLSFRQWASAIQTMGFCHSDNGLLSFRQWAFQSSDQVELDFWSCVIRISLSVKSQGTEKIEVFSQGTDDSKNLRCETLYTADYEHINITSFAVLDIKLRLEEDSDLDTDCPLYSFKFIQLQAQNVVIF